MPNFFNKITLVGGTGPSEEEGGGVQIIHLRLISYRICSKMKGKTRKGMERLYNIRDA